MEPAVNRSSKKKRSSTPQFIRTAKTLLLRRRTKEAINLLRRGLNLEPQCDEAALLLAKALTAVKRLREARVVLEKLLGRSLNLDAAVLLARVCVALDDAPAAMEVVQHALQTAPRDQRLIELEGKIESRLDDTLEDLDEDEEERSTEQHISSRRSLETLESEELPSEDGPTPRPSDGLDFERPPGAPDMVSAMKQLVDQEDEPTPKQLRQSSVATVSAIRALDGVAAIRNVDEGDLEEMPTPPEELTSSPDIVSAIRRLVDEEPDTEETPTPRRPLFNGLLSEEAAGAAPLSPPAPPPLPPMPQDPDDVGGITPPSTPSAIIRQRSLLSGVRSPARLNSAPPRPADAPRADDRSRRRSTSSQLIQLVDAEGKVHQHRIDDSRVVLPVEGAFLELPPEPLPLDKRYLEPGAWAPQEPQTPQLVVINQRARARLLRPWHLVLLLGLIATTVGIVAGLVVRQRGQATDHTAAARELSRGHSAADLHAALLKLREAANLIGRNAEIVALAASVHARLTLEFGESNLKGVEGLIDESLRLGALKLPRAAEDLQVSRAYLHLARKPLPTAIGHLLKSMERHPDNLRLRLLYGSALAANGETFLAGRILDKLPAENSAVLQARAVLSWRKGARTEARALLQAAGRLGLPPQQIALGLALFQVEEGTADAATLKRLDELTGVDVPARQRAWANLLRGTVLQSQGQRQSARQALEQALAHHPTADLEFNHMAGRLLLVQHRVELARREARSALTRSPHDVRFITLMASIELAMDRPEAALKLLTSLDDPSSDARLLMTEAYLLQGQADRAHQQLHLLGEATSPARRILLARTLLAEGLPYKALGALKGLDRESDLLPRLQLVRGLVARSLNNDHEAIRLLRASLKGDPHSVDALINLGELALKANRAQQALDLLERAVSVAPTHKKARVALGQLHLRLEQYSDAEGEFDRALILDSNNVAALIGRARAAIELKSKDASLYIRSVQTRGHRLSAALLDARQALVLGKSGQAAAELSELLNRSLPDRPLAELWLAQALHHQGLQEKAEAAYQVALSSADNIPLAALGLSRIHFQRGDAWTALKYALQASRQLRLGIYPLEVMAQVKLQLTRCYRKTGDLGAAIAELQDILELDRTHGEANLELGRIYHTLKKQDRAVKYLVAALAEDRLKGNAQRELKKICSRRDNVPAGCP